MLFIFSVYSFFSLPFFLFFSSFSSFTYCLSFFFSSSSSFYIETRSIFNWICIELETSKRNKLTISTLCRPPKHQAVDDAALYEEIPTTIQNEQSVIIGNFKCPKINWSTMVGDQERNRVLEMLQHTFMIQIINQPT